jgi:adenine-specific DNA glycosylase
MNWGFPFLEGENETAANPSYELVPEVVERISWLREQFLCWFERSGRSFPWHEPDRTPYEISFAEILLQRTTA